jgi:prepilin-type N-terminal cleavage/methylation domain-containing protein
MTRKQSGLTLIEVMFALSILAVAFLALFSTMLSSSRLAVSSNEDIQALQFAQDKVEELKTAFGQSLLSPGSTTNVQFLTAYQNTNYTDPATNATPNAITPPASLTGNDLIQSLTAAVSSYTGGGATVTTLGGPPSPDYVLPPGSYPPSGANVQHGQLGWVTPDMVNKEIQTRLKNAVCSIHFLTATEYYAATGLSTVTAATNIDLTSTYTNSAGTGLNNVVTPNYSFFPVRVTVTWTAGDNTQRSVSIMTAIYNPTANSATAQMGRYAP